MCKFTINLATLSTTDTVHRAHSKLDKRIVQRRIDLMAEEGIQFVAKAHSASLLSSHASRLADDTRVVGVTHDAAQLRQEHDAVVMATGATWPRDLSLPNRTLDGIHFAMEFLQVSVDSIPFRFAFR